MHAATGYPVAVAFNAGNLAAVTRALRQSHPRARLIVCADDDMDTWKPGTDARVCCCQRERRSVGGAELWHCTTNRRDRLQRSPPDKRPRCGRICNCVGRNRCGRRSGHERRPAGASRRLARARTTWRGARRRTLSRRRLACDSG
ncbi:MAG: hypothetical protein IPG43_05945 [Proteobacteria bacterium]|nr:hypothetical protein [Pseudomonadota bacterium]